MVTLVLFLVSLPGVLFGILFCLCVEVESLLSASEWFTGLFLFRFVTSTNSPSVSVSMSLRSEMAMYRLVVGTLKVWTTSFPGPFSV
uniref:Putative secreted protein n=1 Tax=Xenopsylla cheopis TaxID=163159 RepID=A0A6M2DRP3_XENCH